MLKQPVAKEPLHVAIIMDGNRRWAKANFFDYSYSYEYAIKAIKSAITGSINNNVVDLSLFAFSVENKKRSRAEITILTKLIKKFLQEEAKNLIDNNIKLKIIGNYQEFNQEIAKTIDNLIDQTYNNTKLTLTIALNYSGRQDLTQGINNILKANGNTTEVTEADISKSLFTNYVKDPDILIRTGGEKRISNFFLWQLAYTELFFLDIMWPDFTNEHFSAIIKDYKNRERRYGQ